MQHTKEVILVVGVTLAITIVAFSVLGGSTISQAQTESLDITSVELKKGTSGDALLVVTVKNGGNSHLNEIRGRLQFTDSGNHLQTREFFFTPTALDPGGVTVCVCDLRQSGHLLPGQSFTLSVKAKLPSGSIIQDTAVAIVSRF